MSGEERVVSMGWRSMKKEMMGLNSSERFWRKVDKKSSPKGCWIFTGSNGRSGYCQAIIDGKPISAHRYSYQQVFGKIPEGLTIDHLCSVRNCVNPEHLEAVTMAENLKRAKMAPATINAKKTHCLRGHPFSGENLYVCRNGSRQCKTCMSVHSAKQYAKRKLQKKHCNITV